MIAQVAEAIMNKYRKSVELFTVLLGGLYFQQAPQDVSSPYGVFYITGVGQDEIMGGADDNITEIDVQFNLFTTATDGGYELSTIAEKVTNAYDWQIIYVDGYHYIKMQRENVLPLGYVDEIWQVVVNYSLGLQKE